MRTVDVDEASGATWQAWAPSADDQPPWLVGLTADQRRAVEHRGAPLLVAAGAGSGKTRMLAARTAGLLADGHDPGRLLLLTFTRRAAAELLGRVDALVPERGARRIVGGTFHRFAVSTLRRHGAALGLPPSFSVLDRADAVDLMGIVRAELDLVADVEGSPRRPSAASLVDVLSRVVIAGETLDDVLPARFPWLAPHADDVRRCFDSFTAAKRQSCALDLDDLQLYLRAVLQHDRVGGEVAAGIDHVLVDEVQDVDPVQLDVIDLLARSGAEVTVVGDELQAVYGFRAGDGRGISRFGERFEDAVTIHLSRSFRCPPVVLAIANRIGAPVAPGRPPLVAAERAAPTPTLTACVDEGEEAALVVDRVLAGREHGTPLEAQVVLFRAGHHADRVELELARRDVPYRTFGGLRYLDTAHVRDLVAVLRLVDNPDDELAWHRTLTSLRGIGPVTARRIAEAVGVGRSSVADPVADFVHAEDLPGDADDVRAAQRAIAGVAGLARDEVGEGAEGAEGDEVGGHLADDRSSARGAPPVAVQVDAALSLLERTLPRRHRDAAARMRDLASLAAVAAGYHRRHDLLADLAIDPPGVAGDVAAGGIDEEWLTLSTIHSAKGGEWDVVHLVHAADGNLPSDLAARSSTEMDEERRLTYVAVTRARAELHVTYPVRYASGHGPRDARNATAQASRFLTECDDLLDHRTSAGVDAAAAIPATVLAADGVLVDSVDRTLASLW